ncbi:MAG: PA2169 family four-helix-bundle protein [Pseudomonadota bacterium]
MANKQLIATLNGLIQTCKEGEDSFLACADDDAHSRFKLLFLDRAEDCNLAARELQSLVRAYGGDPRGCVSMGAVLHRWWVDAKSALFGKDGGTVLEECERAEHAAQEKYRAALKSDLRPEARSVVERQYQGVLQNYDLVKTMREQARITSQWQMQAR